MELCCAIGDVDSGPSEEESLANAEFIVRACNCHDDLLEALEELQTQAESIDNWSRLYLCIQKAKAVIQKAKAESQGKEVKQ